MDNPSITRHLNRVRAIHEHPAYTPALDYSDKLVLPTSFLVALCRAGTPSPPLFQVTSLRHTTRSTLCGVLDFSAEEDTVYCPAEVLRILGFYSAYHIKGGLSFTSLQRPVPHLQVLSLHSLSQVEEDSCRAALLQYTVLKTGESKQLWVNGHIVQIRLSHLVPANACVLVDGNFDLHIEASRPKLNRTQTRCTRRDTKRLRLKTPRALQIKRMSISQGKTLPPPPLDGSSEVISFRVTVKRIRTRFLSPRQLCRFC